jgi:hypothetical protein
MTSRLDRGVPNPLSILTVGAMADIGYKVNPAAADSFELGRSRFILEPLGAAGAGAGPTPTAL